MRFLILTVFLSVLFMIPALAISPMGPDMVREAQEYGLLKSKSPLQEFLLPWTSYEEQAVKLDDTSERSYLYTSFLLLATDAREKSQAGHADEMTDSKKLLDDYSGIISFSTVLFGKEPGFVKDSYAVIRQGQAVIKPCQAAVAPESEKIITDEGQTFYKEHCYLYFYEQDLSPERPIMLSILTTDQKTHNFYFDLSKIK